MHDDSQQCSRHIYTPVIRRPSLVSLDRSISSFSAGVKPCLSCTLLSHLSKYPRRPSSSHYVLKHMQYWLLYSDLIKCCSYISRHKCIPTYLQSVIIWAGVRLQLFLPFVGKFIWVTDIHHVKKPVHEDQEGLCSCRARDGIEAQCLTCGLAQDLHCVRHTDGIFRTIFKHHDCASMYT